MYKLINTFAKPQYGAGNASDTPITVIEALDKIIEAIDTKTPFSFTRIGDGEIHLLRNDRPPLTTHIAAKFGMSANDLLEYVRPKIRDAMASDLLGMASPIHDINPKAWILPRREFVDMCFVRQFKFNKRLLNRIFTDKVRVIGCCDIDVEFPYELTKISNPTTKEEAEAVIHADYDEQVIIWGGGGLLKDLGQVQKRKGHICLDFGRTLEAWH